MEHGTETDRVAIEKLIAAEDAAWNSGDAVAYSRAIAKDCVFTNIFGAVFAGHAGFEAQHARIFSTIYRGTRLRQTIDHLRFIRPDVAIVDTSAEVTGIRAFPPGLQAHSGALLTKLLQVFVKDDGAWKIASYHNVDVKPAPPMIQA
ncbi:MAG TPA: SgcJ/EcaC family oxidoreductase [Rhizomicrobium sp.]|jgi:uncharacterized protein (TIGR02246 family)